MKGYLGETLVDIENSDFKDYSTTDWAMYYIECYGQIDGSDHKQWTLDRVSRILKGTKVIVSEAKWSNGHKEYRVILDEPSEDYNIWVKEMRGEFNEYDYDEGIAP